MQLAQDRGRQLFRESGRKLRLQRRDHPSGAEHQVRDPGVDLDAQAPTRLPFIQSASSRTTSTRSRAARTSSNWANWEGSWTTCKPSIHRKLGKQVALAPVAARVGLYGPLRDVAKLFAPHPFPNKPSHSTGPSKPANTSAARDPPRARRMERLRRKVHIQYRHNTQTLGAQFTRTT